MERTNPERFPVLKPGINSGAFEHLEKYLTRELIDLAVARLDSFLFNGTPKLPSGRDHSSVATNVKFWASGVGLDLLTAAVEQTIERLGEL